MLNKLRQANIPLSKHMKCSAAHYLGLASGADCAEVGLKVGDTESSCEVEG